MKLRWVSPNQEFAGGSPDDFRGDLVERETMKNGVVRKRLFWKVGSELEHPQAWLAVKMGVAEPADDECRLKAGMSQEQMDKAQSQYKLLEKGIHPDDYEAYELGLMVGYNPDGTWIPGPNAPEDIDDEELELTMPEDEDE